VSICEHLVERGGITLTVEVDPELPVVRAVSGQLEQVLINLITNAVHAIENGGQVVVRAQVDSPSTVLLEVADSGPGVPDEDRDKIFEPFFTTKSDGKGTGLGLPIVRNIVEQQPRRGPRRAIRSRRCRVSRHSFHHVGLLELRAQAIPGRPIPVRRAHGVRREISSEDDSSGTRTQRLRLRSILVLWVDHEA